jgi:hypothetical protein
MPIFLLGAQLFAGTIYLCGVFAAAIIYHNPTSWKLALASQGFSYLCASAQVIIPDDMEKTGPFVVIGLWLITLALGAVAGLMLL